MARQKELTIIDNEVYDLNMSPASKRDWQPRTRTSSTARHADLWLQLRQPDEQAVRQLLPRGAHLAQEGKRTAR